MTTSDAGRVLYTSGGPQRGVAGLAWVIVVVDRAPIIPEVWFFIAVRFIVHGEQARQ